MHLLKKGGQITQLGSYLTHSKWAWQCVALFSLLESVILPLPIDFLLGPLVFYHQSPWRLVIWAASWSVIGGMIGYLIGFYLLNELLALPCLNHYQSEYLYCVDWFEKWGMITILLGAITPIPYKLVCLTAGALKQPLMIFVLFGFLGRMMRLSTWCIVVKFKKI